MKKAYFSPKFSGMKLSQIFVLFFLFFITNISCKKNESTTGDAPEVTGSFIGRVRFQGNALDVDRENRLIRILRENNSTFRIEFYTGIPNITGIVFEQTNDSTWTSNDNTETQLVKVEGSSLEIDYQLNGQSWKVDAVRR